MSLSLHFILSGTTLYLLPAVLALVRYCFYLFGVQEEWTWNISNNYIIKSDVCIKLKYIWMLLVTTLIA